MINFYPKDQTGFKYYFTFVKVQMHRRKAVAFPDVKYF